MIEGYIGRPGTGKTYTMTARALYKWKRYEAVFANYRVKVPNYEPMHDAEDLLSLKADKRKILVLIDEAHLWFPARLSMRLPSSLLMRMSQTRKAGWDLWWSAQHESRVDRVVRDVSNWLWLCRASWQWFNFHAEAPLVFTATCYEPENFRKPKKAIINRRRLYRPSVARAYDTTESLVTASHVAAVSDHYTNPKKAAR